MLYEKKKLLTYRITLLVLLLLGIIIPIILACQPTESVELVDDNGYLNDYSEILNESTCEIEVTFDKAVNSADITIAFFDSNNKLLSTEKGFFYGDAKTLSSTFFIDGKIDSYEILDCDIDVTSEASIFAVLFVYFDIFIFIMFIVSLFLSCKTYSYNGYEIVVYAGWYHHYIKVDGRKLDEHNTFFYFSPLYLSCTLDDGTNLDVKITKSARISLKINNQLYTSR